jgi:hypothetical protein
VPPSTRTAVFEVGCTLAPDVTTTVLRVAYAAIA